MNTAQLHTLLRRVILVLLALVVIVLLGGESLPVVTQSGTGNSQTIQVVRAAPPSQVAGLTRPRLIFITAQNLILTPDLHFLSLPLIQK